MSFVDTILENNSDHLSNFLELDFFFQTPL